MESKETNHKDPRKEFTAFKLIVDPALVKASFKSYRYDGRLHDDPTYPTVVVKDPRNRMRQGRLEDFELPLPLFKIDRDYVGVPPAIQITVTNLNDNIDRNFFKNILAKHWNDGYEEFQIYHHPVTHKHLGVAHVTFKRPSFARSFLERLNNTSIMGQKISVCWDPHYVKCKQLLEELTTEKKTEENVVENNGNGGSSNKTSSSKGKEHKGKKQGSSSSPLKKEKALPASTPSSISSSSILETPGSGTHGPPLLPPVPFTNGGKFHMPDAGIATAALDAQGVYAAYNYMYVHPHPPLPPTPDKVDGTPFPPVVMPTNFDDDDDFFSPKVDLDTRIKLIFAATQGRHNPILPFLDSSSDDEKEKMPKKRRRSQLGLNDQIWSSEEETVESAFAKKFKKNTFVPVGDDSNDASPPPSPFLSMSENDLIRDKQSLSFEDLERLKQQLESELQKMSDESADASPQILRRKVKREEDKRSPEDPSLINLPPNPPLPTDLPPLPPEDLPPLPTEPSLMPSQFYPTPNGYWNVSFSNSYVWNTGEGAVPYYNPVEYNAYQQPMANMGSYEQCSDDESDDELNPLEVSKMVMDRVCEEMKKILYKDFHRRLLEYEAYKLYDSWCQKREEYYKQSTKQQQEAKSTAVETKEIKAEQSEVRFDGTCGPRPFRFSMAIPKFPSFVRNRQPATPVDEDSRPSYGDSDSEKYSDSDDDEAPVVNKKALRKLSLSSDESASSSSLSSDSSSEVEEEEEEASDDDVEEISEEDLETTVPESKSTLKTLVKSYRPALATTVEEETPQKPIKERVKEENKYDFSSTPSQDKNEISTRVELTIEAVVSLDTSHLLDHSYARPPVEEDFYKKLKEVHGLPPQSRKSRHEYRKVYSIRDGEERATVLYDMFYSPLDEEDLQGFKTSFEKALKVDPHSYWLNSTHWVDYPVTAPSPKIKKGERVHKTGSARSEGFYQLTKPEKMANRRQWGIVTATEDLTQHIGGIPEKQNVKMQLTISREIRSNQRRLLTSLGNEIESDLLRFNQLKFRKKNLRFGRSTIHDWGLFASEAMAADEMVIEYVGQMIRPVIADIREKKYMAIGIGSSYLFRIDLENIIDATRGGNLSRFINHSCNPNCYAKIITIEGKKKIVIYSKQPIGMNEEITYDYKFPIEDEKIPCLCGSYNCRGTLN